MDDMRGGQAVTPARVETVYARLLQDREIRSNLAARTGWRASALLSG